VSLFLTLPCAQHCIEFLVRRYRADVYIPGSLILSCVHLHANPIFPRMIFALQRTLPKEYKGLAVVAKHQAGVPRSAIREICIRTPGMLDSVLKHYQHLPPRTVTPLQV
ncbi:hypothetical protein KIPB_015994, partial [Kipferlia bialata]